MTFDGGRAQRRRGTRQSELAAAGSSRSRRSDRDGGREAGRHDDKTHRRRGAAEARDKGSDSDQGQNRGTGTSAGSPALAPTMLDIALSTSAELLPGLPTSSSNISCSVQ